METVLKIRRMYQLDSQSISSIAKVTGLSRNTVRKYLRQPPSELPKYRRTQPARPKLGEFEPTLTQWTSMPSGPSDNAAVLDNSSKTYNACAIRAPMTASSASSVTI
ncbi:TPA: hypothetical protein P2Q98_003543 [Aeromonas veronii]|uniref:hypothetical protein n=1 Tax=Aeromonas veronii TaxID=654 RepID=UPI00330D9A4F|nr:hypothetical protein [Aeromonas veronii]HDO1335317.1 hypothetical protein [Aeromonas veronii]HDO1338503.1 hypothetical protein [Aeromonas veronii]HDO1343614.1 hypothetical protein [Aeromonas veronii]HDO1348235.1 hypothetical protein [Aeromonas veronii]